MIKLGLRGSSDAVNYILIKIDDLTLMTTENLFLAGEEYRKKTGKNLIKLLDSLSRDHEISFKDNLGREIERELSLDEKFLNKYLTDV